MTAPQIKHVFYNHIKSCRYMFKNGKAANFVDGKYFTDDPTEIEELNEDVRLGHEYIFVNPKELTIDLAKMGKLDIDEIRRKAVEDYVKNQERANNPKNDMGGSASSNTGIKTSATVAGLTANSNAGVKLASLPTK